MRETKTFSSLFYYKEYRELTGKNKIVLKRLVILITLTFCALGFASGGLDQLREKMADPFTRWVDFTVDSKAEKQFGDMTDFLKEPESRANFNLEGYSNWNRYWLYFHQREHNPLTQDQDTLIRWQKGRTIDFENELFNNIISDLGGNLIYLNEDLFDEAGDLNSYCGIIVTEDLLTKLGYLSDEYSLIKSLSVNVMQGKELLFLPVIAVVKSLPSRSDFMSSHHLDNILQGSYKYDKLLLTNSSDTSQIRLIGSEADQEQELLYSLKRFFPDANNSFLIQSETLFTTVTESYRFYRIILPDNATKSAVQEWLRLPDIQDQFSSIAEVDCSDYASEIQRSMYRTFNFNDLSKIEAFRKEIKDRFDIKLPMELVENRKNFDQVATLTFILGTALFVFGLLSILLYLSSIVNNHVNKIQPHIGTFKAMGLQDKELLSTYSKISLKMLLMSFIFALPLALILGLMVNHFIGIGFSLFNFMVAFGVSVVLACIPLLIRSQLKRVFSATPGDLIYERQNS